jgi:hypothetical protein
MGNYQQDINHQDPSYIHSLQVLDRIKEMHNAKAKEDWVKYWYEFHSAVGIMSGHLSIEVKKRLQNNFDRLAKAEVEIKKKYKDKKTVTSFITELRTDFVLSNEIYILSSLSNLDIIKKSDDGEIKTSDYELDELEKLIRHSSSNPEIDRKIEARSNDKNK